MDLMSTAELLGNFGEFIASVGVLGSLVYLAVQIKQNTKATRVAARAQTVESTTGLRGRMIDNDLLRVAILKMVRGDALTEEEEFILYHNTAMAIRHWEHQHYQYVHGELDVEAYRSYQNVWRRTIHPYTKEIWPRLRDEFTPAFAREMDVLMQEETSESR